MPRQYNCISGDGHIDLNPDIWRGRVQSKYRDRAPKRIKMPSGSDAVVIDGGKPNTIGITRSVRVAHADLAKQVRTAGGLHVAIVTSAAKAAYDTALKCLRPGGTLAVVGLPPEALSFMPLALVGPEIRIVAASVGTRDDMRAVLALAAAGKLRCEVEAVPLEQVNEVHARMQRGAIRGRMVLRCC